METIMELTEILAPQKTKPVPCENLQKHHFQTGNCLTVSENRKSPRPVDHCAGSLSRFLPAARYNLFPAKPIITYRLHLSTWWDGENIFSLMIDKPAFLPVLIGFLSYRWRRKSKSILDAMRDATIGTLITGGITNLWL